MVTIILAACLLSIYVIDIPNHDLLNYGLVSGRALRQGEWYRLFTAPLMHLNAIHIFGNIGALLLVGLRTESLIGPVRFLLVFATSALIGALGSAAINPPNVGSVGASGAIQGLFFAMYVAGLAQGRRTAEGQRICQDALGLGILGMVYSSLSAPGVDLIAHICGALAGGLAGLLLIAPAADAVPECSRHNGYFKSWRVGAAGALMIMATALVGIIVTRPILPYAFIRFGGLAAVLLTALAISLYDSLSSTSPMMQGAPFTIRRIVSTQGGKALFVLGVGAVLSLCMYFR